MEILVPLPGATLGLLFFGLFAAVVAGGAEGLPVRLIPEKSLVTAMRYFVIGSR